MSLRLHSTFLPHRDPDASLSFYRDVLGLEVRLDVGQGTFRWITVGAPGQDASIVLEPPYADTTVNEDERRTVTEMMAKGTFPRVILATHDLDATFARVRDAGAEVVHEPTTQPYGVRDFAVRDPAGNLVRVNEVS